MSNVGVRTDDNNRGGTVAKTNERTQLSLFVFLA